MSWGFTISPHTFSICSFLYYAEVIITNKHLCCHHYLDIDPGPLEIGGHTHVSFIHTLAPHRQRSATISVEHVPSHEGAEALLNLLGNSIMPVAGIVRAFYVQFAEMRFNWFGACAFEPDVCTCVLWNDTFLSVMLLYICICLFCFERTLFIEVY